MSKRGLGKGLGALLSDSSIAREKDQQTGELSNKSNQDSPLMDLDVTLLQSGKYQPRKAIEQGALKELSESIKKQGIIQPVVVRKIANNRYEIIAGERRWRAAKLANLSQIPCIVKNIDDNAAIAMALIENIQREDLNVIEEAQALERLQSEFKLTHQQIADAIGKSRTTVSNLMRLNALNDDVKAFVIDKKLEMGHARCLLSLDFNQQSEVAKIVIEKSLTVRETESLVSSILDPKKSKKQKENKLNFKELESKLAENLGAKVAINSTQKGKGKLVISYTNQQQLDQILSKIS